MRKLRTGLMPPDGRPRPDAATYASLVSHLETALDRAAETAPNPGWPAQVHRLNRAEYANAVRDLLGLEVDGRALLPADDSGYGFDNIGDVLTVSPGLMSRYMSAAAKISRRAIGDPTLRPGATMYKTSPLLLQEGRMSEDLPFGSRGGMAVRHHFPLDAEYVFRISLERPLNQPVAGTGHKLEFRLEHGLVKLFDFDTDEYRRAGSGAGVGGLLDVRMPVKAGTRLVSASFIGSLDRGIPYDARPPNPPVASFQYSRVPINPIVFSIQVNRSVQRPGARRRRGCAQPPVHIRVQSRTAGRRGVLRPGNSVESGPPRFPPAGNRRGRGPAAGVVRSGVRGRRVRIRHQVGAGKRCWSRPNSCCAWSATPEPVEPGTPYRVSDVDLASRLSFFLWSSIPDEELLALAEAGRLSEPAVLEQQVLRMLDDPRSSALTTNFAGQWLFLRNLRTAAPNGTLFPTFDDNLREAFQRETELFFDSQVRTDRSVLDLLSADYTFLNDRLARHYGIQGVYGSHYRRVDYPDDRRAGLLGHGSILTVTSHPNRTSPVVRGKWLLENLLGAPPPPPPPDVPALIENDAGIEPATVRERMEQHRANPTCAACHAKMDPLGFALENFDAVGQWRSVDPEANAPIDASGTLPDGTMFTKPAEFRRGLLAEPWASEFVGTVTEKLLTYAIGRGLEYYDAPAVRAIKRDAAASGYRWSSIVQGIVQSAPFQMRRMPDPDAASAQ